MLYNEATLLLPCVEETETGVETAKKQFEQEMRHLRGLSDQTVTSYLNAVNSYLRNGCDLESLRKLMGHNNISATQRYLHVTDMGLEETHKKYF